MPTACRGDDWVPWQGDEHRDRNVRYCERIRLLPMIRFDSYGTGMAKPYRSRIDSRNHLREVNAARRNQSERSGVAKVLANAKDTAKAMLGF